MGVMDSGCDQIGESLGAAAVPPVRPPGQHSGNSTHIKVHLRSTYQKLYGSYCPFRSQHSRKLVPGNFNIPRNTAVQAGQVCNNSTNTAMQCGQISIICLAQG